VSKVSPPNPFELNLKMMYNDVEQIRQRAKRMWACAESAHDFSIVEDLESRLEIISNRIVKTLDKS